MIKKIIKSPPNKWKKKWDKMPLSEKIGWSIITLGIRPLLNLNCCCSAESIDVGE